MTEGKQTVRFLQPYRGKLTGEIFYEEGDVIAFMPIIAEALIEGGRAEPVKGKGARVHELTPSGEVAYSEMSKSDLLTLLQARGVEPGQLVGSGEGGRVVKADLVAHLEELDNVPD